MLMKERNLDIIGLCETRLTGEGTKILHDDYQLFYKGGMEARHGVGFIVTKELAERVGYLNYKSERIISFSIEFFFLVVWTSLLWSINLNKTCLAVS